MNRFGCCAHKSVHFTPESEDRKLAEITGTINSDISDVFKKIMGKGKSHLIVVYLGRVYYDNIEDFRDSGYK